MVNVDPVPIHLRGDAELFRWLQDFADIFNQAVGLGWGEISKSGSNLSELEFRDHADLTNVLLVAAGADAIIAKHITDAQYTSIVNDITNLGQNITNSANDLTALETTLNNLSNTVTNNTNSINTNANAITDLQNRLAAAGIP